VLQVLQRTSPVTTDLIRFADCYIAGHSVVQIPLEGI